MSKDSSNSSKPPSTDGLSKKQKNSSLREKSGKKPGGQPGHTGRTLVPVENPDYIEIHTSDACENCRSDLVGAVVINVEKRQVFDLPAVSVEVTEHQVEKKLCPCCGHKNKGQFSDHVKAPVQYGEQVRALAAYFEHQHLIPFERLSQIFEDVYGIFLSPGTCHNADKKLFKNLKGEWAKKMETLLLRANKAVDQAKTQGQNELDDRIIQQIEQEYAKIILERVSYYQDRSQFLNLETEPPDRGDDKSGFNLLRRFLRKMDATLAFMYNLEVPFTNNEAEQAIRMQKVKQKISGCFRSFEGGVISCRIRSYISTARKQSWGILDALVDAIRGARRLLTV